ncbi:MAG: PKD domain-containing protein [Bacteroidetes bacterium]|nr:PKD domain-containing protein [Bacteroidota bacterium]
MIHTRNIFNLLLICVLAISSVLTACKKDDEEVPTFSDEEQQAYDHVLNLQDDVSSQLDSWFLIMDSLDAIELARQEFVNDPAVSTAIISSQGISVQYANGMRGALFLNPEDGESFGESSNTSTNNSQISNNNGLKSLVNKRQMLTLNPHYYERAGWTNYIINNQVINLPRVDIQGLNGRNDVCTLDIYADLTDYGIIQFYSHGYAWPKKDSIIDVYMLTGETVSNSTSAKYREDLNNGNVMIVESHGHNKYFISKNFIENHNDFSQDTVLIYGGFCYSFLGNWPDIVESCAQGTYFGFDWSVFTSRNAEWSVDLIDKLSDTSINRPFETQDWMTNTDLEKSYWDDIDERTVHILYSGDPSLKLWDKKIELIPLSEDGAPILVNGLPNVAYPFKCKVISPFTDLEYVWDIGDGSEPFTTTDNEVEATWTQSGIYELTVTVNNRSTGEKIGKETLTAVIGSITPTWNSVAFKLSALKAVIKCVYQPEGTTVYNDWSVDWIYDSDGDGLKPGVYQNGTFTSSWNMTDDNGWTRVGSITLHFDEQANKIVDGTIHAELSNPSGPDPDDYEFIDISINEINASNWTATDGYFSLNFNDFCNTNHITDVYHEQFHKQGSVVTNTYTLESYSCDDTSPHFHITLKTE